jgi:hypothetical protein
MALSTIRIDTPLRDAIDCLKADLRKENGLKASREEIVGALVCGVSAAQASGMLTAYIKHATDAGGDRD